MNRPRMTIAVVCAGALALAAARDGLAQSRPAAGADRPLARYIPANDLLLYVEIDGLDAHAPAWKKSALYRLLNETKLGAMLDDLLAQGVTQFLAADGDKEKPTTAELIGMYKATFRDGAAFGIAGRPSDPNNVVALGVFRNGVRSGLLDYIKRVGTAKSVSERRGARTVFRSTTGGPSWWAEGDDLVLVPSDEMTDRAIAAIDGKAPNATTHPLRNELMKAGGGFEPFGVAFVDFTKVPMPPDAAQYGLDGLKRLDYRFGFQDEALASVFRVIAPAPRRGALALFEAPTFDRNSLPPVPAGLASWTAFSFTPAAFYEKFKGIARRRRAPWGRGPSTRSSRAYSRTCKSGSRRICSASSARSGSSTSTAMRRRPASRSARPAPR